MTITTKAAKAGAVQVEQGTYKIEGLGRFTVGATGKIGWSDAWARVFGSPYFVGVGAGAGTWGHTDTYPTAAFVQVATRSPFEVRTTAGAFVAGEWSREDALAVCAQMTASDRKLDASRVGRGERPAYSATAYQVVEVRS